MAAARPRRPGGRRPIPPLVFLLVLAVLALAVWWKVLKQDETSAADREQACASATADQAAVQAVIDSVKVRVYNASERAGLAGSVTEQLTQRGFTVTETANDESGRPVGGAGELRFGPKGELDAKIIAAHMPSLAQVPDQSRSDSVVDVALGPGWVDFAPLDQATQKSAELAGKRVKAETC